MKITGKVAERKDGDKKKESMDSIYKVENQLDKLRNFCLISHQLGENPVPVVSKAVDSAKYEDGYFILKGSVALPNGRRYNYCRYIKVNEII